MAKRCKHNRAFPWLVITDLVELDKEDEDEGSIGSWKDESYIPPCVTMYEAKDRGVMWCPDCGAVREIEGEEDGSLAFSTRHWTYPRGKTDVERQMQRNKRFDDPPETPLDTPPRER